MIVFSTNIFRKGILVKHEFFVSDDLLVVMRYFLQTIFPLIYCVRLVISVKKSYAEALTLWVDTLHPKLTS